MFIQPKPSDLSVEEAKRKIEELQRHIQAKDSEKTKGVTLYKRDGSILAETDKRTVIEAVLSSKANLYGADLYEADLREADLREADLYGANLYEADLSGADLSGANLREADLYGANLYEADLSKANLSGANLSGAKFYGRGGNTKIKKSQIGDFLTALGVVAEE